MAGDTKAEDRPGVESPLTVEGPKGERLQAWFADHGRVASDASLFVSQRLISSFLVWLMVGVALTLPGLLWVGSSIFGVAFSAVLNQPTRPILRHWLISVMRRYC